MSIIIQAAQFAEKAHRGQVRKYTGRPYAIGRRFGRLKIVGKPTYIKGKMHVECHCKCGRATVVFVSNLKSGHTESCGCLVPERTSEVKRTHGQSRTRLHNIWLGMKNRCDNPNVKAYKKYGGRGIKVCRQWYKFENFQVWAISNGYTPALTLDRKNRDRGYSPSNCRWATRSQQTMNTAARKDTGRFKGVQQRKSTGSWEVVIRSGGKAVFRRTVRDEISAAWVREKVIQEFHGEFAYMNHPPERRKRNKKVLINRRKSA